MASVNVTLMTLRLEVEKWLESLPTPLRTEVRNNYVLAGGSIVSTILDLPVNDYDIWISDNRVLANLLNFYIEPLGYTAYISADTETVSIKNKTSHVLETGLFLYKFPSNPIVDTISHFSVTLRNKFQIIYMRNALYPRELVNTFDFAHNKVYITNDSTNLDYYTESVIKDPQLIYTGSTQPISTLIRVAKHVNKGKIISAETLAKIAKDIVALPKEQQLAECQFITVDSQGLVVTV